MVILVVLVKHRRNLFPILSDREQGLLVVMGGNVEEEEIDAGEGSRENSGVNIHPAAHVARDPLKAEIFFASPVISLLPVKKV